MSALQVLGGALLCLPFVALFVLAWRTLSLRDAVGIFVFCGLLVGCVWLGTSLATGRLA